MSAFIFYKNSISLSFNTEFPFIKDAPDILDPIVESYEPTIGSFIDLIRVS